NACRCGDDGDRSRTMSAAPAGKRLDILDAAREIFLREGFDLTSMEAIAVEAGVSKQTVYNHFDGKEDLFRAFVRTVCEKMGQAFEARFVDTDDSPQIVLSSFGQRSE